MAKKTKLSKSEQIGEWKEKGIDWLANRLWEARKRNEELKRLNAKVRQGMLSIRGYWKVEEINRNLAFLFFQSRNKTNIAYSLLHRKNL